MAHFGWTWDYLLWGIKWHIVEKMMVDAPSYKSEKKSKADSSEKGSSAKDTSIKLTNENKLEVMALLNSKY